ncbi:MAG: nucleotidyltransferase domain-containing protein [Thermoplasmata archaeon]
MKRPLEGHCYRCGYVWTRRRSVVRICPRCKSPYFWLPKVRIPTGGSGLGIEDVIGKNRTRVLRLARKYGARDVRVFGSVARKEATKTSDVDILVEPRSGKYRPVDLALALRDLLGRRVDLVSELDLYWLIQPQAVTEAVPL